MLVRNRRPWPVEIAPAGRYPVDVGAAGDVLDDGSPADVVDVPDDVAGRPPAGDDPGEGLLAQTDNWEPADRPAPKAKKGGDS